MGERWDLASKIVHEEHEQMRKPCEKCGGKMDWHSQALRADEEPGDYITYICTACDTPVTRFFPFPEEYAKIFRISTQRTNENGEN